MKITQHYLTINSASGKRRVHYRRCGSGPTLLMAHQSPRSSAEYEDLMLQWGEHFTCIAPDTPGFGQSGPLHISDPDINDYADATVEFMHALGIVRTAAYGFHSGGIILVTALKRHPQVFSGLGVGGYAIWSKEEMELFGEAYLPEFHPDNYGEHLTWLWNRILEQSWFFPWFNVAEESRLSVAHADPQKVHAVVMDMLDSGHAYRAGYGAVLSAPRDIPASDADVPPCLITAYDGDPLQIHIDRMGDMPPGWNAHKVSTPKDHQNATLEFLKLHATNAIEAYREDDDSGFLHVTAGAFSGQIHWMGKAGATTLQIHAPGSAANVQETASAIAIDMPGHGLSDDWADRAPTDWAEWQAVIDAAAAALGCTDIRFAPLPAGDAKLLYPDLTPDRFGSYLTTAWQIVRAVKFFSPWYAPGAKHAIEFDSKEITAENLAQHHKALIRAVAAKEFHEALQFKDS